MIPAGNIDSGNTKLGRDNRTVGEGTLRSFEAFAGDVVLEVNIVATIENGVARAFAVKLDYKFKRVDFFGQFVLLMSKAEGFSSDAVNFFFARKEQPQLDLRGTKDFFCEAFEKLPLSRTQEVF